MSDETGATAGGGMSPEIGWIYGTRHVHGDVATEGLVRPVSIAKNIVNFQRLVFCDGEIAHARHDRISLAEWQGMRDRGEIFRDLPDRHRKMLARLGGVLD